MSKFLGFLLGAAVALAGPAVFGVLAAPGGIELNAKGMALAYGLGALIFWAVVSYFSGAAALGAFAAFGTLVYCWLWIPNRTTNFLNDVPGVTKGMIDGSKQYTLNGVVPILGVISLVYAIQLIVRSVQRRRRERVEAERLQREQEAAQAQQEADVAAVYPVAGGTYQAPAAYQSHTSYDDLFDEPEPVQPRNQADEQTRQFPVGEEAEFEHTRAFPAPDAEGNHTEDETVAAPVPVAEQAEEPTQQAEVREEAAPEPADETQPVNAGKPVEPQPLDETRPMETKPAETKPTDAQPADASAEAAEKESGPAEGAGTAGAGTVGAAPAPAAPVEPQPVETQPVNESKPAEPQPVEETQPMETRPVNEAKSMETEPADAGSENAKQPADAEQVAKAEQVGKAEPVGKAEQVGKVSPKEEMGSQYRERMEDPEDTGEFFLAAFENPAVKPA